MRLAILKDNEMTRIFINGLRAEYSNIDIKVFLTSQNSFNAAFKLYTFLPKIIKHPDEVKILESDLEKSVSELNDLSELEKRVKRTSITEIFSLILAAAIKIEASDIHIEAEEKAIELRFRIDGVLHTVAKLNKDSWDHLISRIKLNAKLKINVKDKPQDGHFSVKINQQSIDFRVSTLPTAFGESVVMRILYHDKVKNMNLDKLGIEGYNREIIDKEIKKPNGMVIITGPTGSGKTTTLYAILNKLNTTDNKIITIEDPIEYKIEGINQSEINKDKDYTFAKALRSVVRQDPDIVLVGEIRDKETAEISLNAALTGHLLFSTLHTNDAVGAIPRFLSLGSKPYLLAPAINVSIAQRLVRKVCEYCKQEENLNEETKEIIKQEMESLPESYKNKMEFDIKNLKFYKGKGCKKCTGLGYKGQLGIFESFVITDEIRDLILVDKVSEHQLNEVAHKNGMITMRQDGILKAAKGITSLDEVLRVT
jgi:type II secretory ATPase GspE/PulE/Tfp pilus assembly ATPase PilB-like protein